jgi:putative membrane protein
MLVVVVLLALIVVVTVLLVRHFGERRPGSASAQEILDERFARGEIDADEYRQRRDALWR